MNRMVSYRDGDQSLNGYFSRHDAFADRPRPGVIVVHTFMGLIDPIKRRADRLAEMGYAAFALDVFGPGVFPQPGPDGLAAIRPFQKDRLLFRRRLAAGLETLAAQPECDSTRLAAIGYCFGGCAVLEMARAGLSLAGVVSLHGELDTPLPVTQPGAIKGKVLVLHGDVDPIVPPESVTRFEEEMRKAQANWEIDIYGAARHSFTSEGTAPGHVSPEAGLHPQSERRSWKRMSDFLEEIFCL